MAYVQADVDLMNMALRKVGAEAITLAESNTPTQKTTKVIVTYYLNTLKEILRLIPWNSCIARAELTGEEDDDEITEYSMKYSLATLIPFPLWAASTAYAMGAMMVTTAGNWYVCVHAGTSHATTEPTTTTDETVFTDGTAKWICLGSYSYTTMVRFLDINNNPLIRYRIEGTTLYCDEGSEDEPINVRYIKLPSGYSTEIFADPLLIEAVVSRLASKICYAITSDESLPKVFYQEYVFAMNQAQVGYSGEVYPEEEHDTQWVDV